MDNASGYLTSCGVRLSVSQSLSCLHSPSGEPSGTQWSPVPSTHTPHTLRPVHQPKFTTHAPRAPTTQAGHHVPAELKPTSHSAGRNSTQPGPTPRPPQAHRTTDPPFIGDSYETKDLPALTVSPGHSLSRSSLYVNVLPVPVWKSATHISSTTPNSQLPHIYHQCWLVLALTQDDSAQKGVQSAPQSLIVSWSQGFLQVTRND